MAIFIIAHRVPLPKPQTEYVATAPTARNPAGTAGKAAVRCRCPILPPVGPRSSLAPRPSLVRSRVRFQELDHPFGDVDAGRLLDAFNARR